MILRWAHRPALHVPLDIDSLQDPGQCSRGLNDVTHDFDTSDRIGDKVKPIVEPCGGQRQAGGMWALTNTVLQDELVHGARTY